MKKFNKRIIPYIIITCLMITGILLFVFNASNIGDNTIFNEEKPKEEVVSNNSVGEGSTAGDTPGNIGISPEVNASFLGVKPALDINVAGEEALSGNYAVIGVLISVLSLVAKLVFDIMDFRSNRSSKARLIDGPPEKKGMSVDDKLAELLRLKEKGTVSEEEYKNLRAKVLENFCTL